MRITPFLFLLLVFLVSCSSIEKSKPSPLVQANQYARDGLWREAAESYKRILANKPDYMAAHRNLGMVQVKLGDFKSGIKHLEKSLPQYDRNFDSNYYLAEAYRGLEKFDEAIFYYKKSLKTRPNELRALRALAWSYFLIRFYSKSLITSKEILKISKKDEQGHIILIRTLVRLLRWKSAFRSLRIAQEHAKKSSLPYFKSIEGDIYYGVGKIDKAFESYRLALKEQPLLASALLGLGRVLSDRGDKKKATEYLERAIRVRPRLSEAYLLLARVSEALGKKPKALRYYRHFLKQAATDPEFLSELGDVRGKISQLKIQVGQQKGP